MGSLKASLVVDYSEGKHSIHLQSFLHVSFAVLRFGCHNPPLVFFLQLFCEINDVLEDLFLFLLVHSLQKIALDV